MSTPKIFISHSAHDPNDRQFMEALVGQLRGKGFRVYCDYERLKLGNEWRDELYSAIGSCHAAIVLITKDALNTREYPWVFLECSMLTIINWGKPDFPIYPIRMTGVSIQDIENSPLNQLKITSKQVLSLENLDRIVETISADLCKLDCSMENEPYYYHHKRIEGHLSTLPQALVAEAIEHIDSELDRWDPLDKEVCYRLSRMLLFLKPDRITDALLNIFPSLGMDRTQRLIDFIAPFWVNLPAITKLEEITHSELIGGSHAGRTILGINAFVQDTGCIYIHRAGYLKKIPYHVIRMPEDAGEDDIGRFASHIHAEMKRRAGLSGRSLEEECKRLAQKRPIFIVFPYGTSKEVIRALYDRFNFFIFVILTGQDELERWDLENFIMLNPLLEKGKEDLVYTTRQEVLMDATGIIEG